VERMASYVDIGNSRFDLGHMTSHALAACAAGGMVCMSLDCCGMGTVRGRWPVAGKTKLVRRPDQIGIVGRAVHVMATEAGDSTPVHDTLNKVITLHAILVTGPVGEMHKVGLTQFMLFETPEVFQVQPLMKSNRPIVVLPLDRICQRLSLRVT